MRVQIDAAIMTMEQFLSEYPQHYRGTLLGTDEKSGLPNGKDSLV